MAFYNHVFGTVLVLCTFTGDANAGGCGYEYCWGAVASADSGAYGWSYGQISQGDAIELAQGGCKGQCAVVKTFYNTCGAISVGDGGIWGWGWHDDRETAISLSLSYCADNANSCQPRVWVCSK